MIQTINNFTLACFYPVRPIQPPAFQDPYTLFPVPAGVLVFPWFFCFGFPSHPVQKVLICALKYKGLVLVKYYEPVGQVMQEHLAVGPVSYTHLRAHETVLDLVCRLLLEKKKKK